MSIQQNINLKNLKKAVFSLKKRGRRLHTRENQILRDKKENERCLSYLQMILDTHQRKTTPPHTSGNYLLFFVGGNGDVALIKELLPPDELMPEMQRISIDEAMRCPMKINGDDGYLIEKVYFGDDEKTPTSTRFIICLKRMLVENL